MVIMEILFDTDFLAYSFPQVKNFVAFFFSCKCVIVGNPKIKQDKVIYKQSDITDKAYL